MQRVRKTTRTARQRRRAQESHAGRREGGFGGIRKLIALLLLIPTFVVQAATSTSAGAAVVAGFEIDGNTADDAVTGVDWDTPGIPGVTPDLVGKDDTTNFGVGSKEFDHPSTWERKTGVAPPQDDISGVYFHDDIVDGDIWGYVGLRRFTTSGTTNFDVEFNKLPNASGATYVPVRSVGDVMVRFEQDGSAAFELTEAWFWTRVASASWGAGCIEVPGYTPRSGWCSEAIGSVPFTGATGESGHFAEGAFNFSSLLDAGGIGGVTCAGGDFGTMNIRSFTGNSDESALKDYINPVTIDIDDTCGDLEIYKVDQLGNLLPGATFSISPNPIPGQSASPLVITEGQSGDPDGEADGDITFSPASPDVYTVVETAGPPPAGTYELVPLAERTWTVTVTSTETAWRLTSQPDATPTEGPLYVTNRRYFAPPTIVNNPKHDRDYSWLVTKSIVGPSTKNVPEGTKASFGYEVLLKALDPVPGDYSDFDGSLKVTNPNAFDMEVTLETRITGGAPCTIDDAATIDVSNDPGVQVDLEPGDNFFTYSCPAADPAGGTTASVTWDQDRFPQEAGQQGPPVTAAASFTLDLETHKTTTVNDVFNGEAADAKSWGPFTWGDVRGSDSPAAHTVVVDTYTRDEVPGVAGTCTPYDNLVTETADGTTDTETVEVCVGKDLSITKDANLGYERELLWKIAKGGPGTVFTGADADGKLQRVVRYTIDITADGVSDSDWALTGTISVTNPNTWDVVGTISDTVVVDGKTLTCVVDGGNDAQPGVAGQQVTVPKATSTTTPRTLQLGYVCPGVIQGAYVGNNTVSFDFSADSHEYPDADDTVAHTEAVTVTDDASPTNLDVTIKDLLENQDVTGTLPKSSFNWTEVNKLPGHTERVSYDVLLSTTEDACTPYRNVVSINGLTYPGSSDDHTVTVCSPGVVKDHDAEFGQKRLWAVDKDVKATKVDIEQGGTATFTYTVTAEPGDVVDNGKVSWTGSVTVSNPSTDTPLTVSIKDVPAVQGWVCAFNGDDDTVGNVVVAAGQDVTVSYTCTTQGQGHPDGSNTAEVTFDGGQKVSETVGIEFDPAGTIDDTVVDVYDDKTNPGAPPVLLGTADADKPATQVFTYSLTKSGVAGECTTYTNTATIDLTASDDVSDVADAEVCVEMPIEVEVSGSGKYGVTYPWTIEKILEEPRTVEVDAATGKAAFDYQVKVTAGEAQPAGWTLSGVITVENPNTTEIEPIELIDVDVSTDVGGGADCSATLPEDPIVGQGEVEIPFSCTFTGEPSTSGTVTADVEWDPAGDDTSDTESDSSSVSLSVGEGRETDRFIDVWDDKTDPDNPVLLEDDLEWSDELVKVYDYELTHEGVPGECTDFTNTAWLELDGDDPEDSTTATVCVEKPLEPEVSGSADLARAYAWSITKVADATQRTVDASGNATFTYTVTAKAGASTDSGWQLEGSVTIVNPNKYAEGDLTADVTAATTVGGGSACTVARGEDVTIQDSSETTGSVTLPIACTFSSQPSGSGTLDVTSTWDPAGEATTASATDSTPITFAVRSETNKTVQVVDDKTVSGQRVVLDPALTWAPGLVKTYTYSLAVAGGGAGSCQSHTNTATIDQPVGTDPTATAVVLACTPAVEVLPVQSFGKAVGSVKASCQGTVRAKLANRSGESVTYQLRVGTKVHKIMVRSQASKKFVTKGKALAKVTLKVGSTRLDKLRIPALCEAPEVLPDTGLRSTSS